jgi:hypothetical protein
MKHISLFRSLNLVIRVLVEIGVLIGPMCYGYQLGQNMMVKILLSFIAALLVFGFWSLVDFHQCGRNAELFRLLQELILSALAAFFFFKAGLHRTGWILAVLSVIHHVLLYLLGDRLLKK